MTCRTCGAGLAPGTRFCPSCGTPVEATCVTCGAALTPDARFCAACGTPTGVTAGAAIAPSSPGQPATTRERKVATIVFADLVGFTSLNERLDPEHVQALVGRAFDRLSLEVTRYEGYIEKFAGDAMLAIFGVPAIHEDDAERAVRAALEMQAVMTKLAGELKAEGRPELALRIGVETGEILVDLARAADERDRIVIGDAVNTAARLQQAAGSGAVMVGGATYAATRDLIDYEELTAIPLKGKELPVAAWRAMAVKARRGGVRAPLGIEAPLIGRDEEIGLLKETVRRTVSEGRPHLVTVIGSAGVGKFRLTWELEKYLDGLPDVYTWRKGRCLAYAQASYSALADVVKVDAHVLDDDAPATALAKVDARLAELGSAVVDPSIREALRAVLGLGSTTPTTRELLFDGWRRYLEALAHDAPLILVLEDIHWADDGLLDFIEFAARWTEAPIMILALARHELVERRPAWGGGIPNATNLVLEPLDAAESVQLLDHLLAGGMPAVLRDRVVALADGNPLFTEELVRMFADQGVIRFADDRWELARAVDELEVPGSIQAVLAARLDGLPASEKRLAQDAAVVGRIFWDAILTHLARQGASSTTELLRRLRVKELVVPRQPSTLAGSAEYGFRHVLIRDVAYDSLPKRDRAAKHLDVAEWAERELADRAEEMVELLASHYLSALTYEEEFGASDPKRLKDLRLRTYGYARKAAARARLVDQQALWAEWLNVAIRLAGPAGIDPRERIALTLEYVGTARGMSDSPERVIPAVELALRVSDALDRAETDEDSRYRLIAAHATALYQNGQVDRARGILTTALAALLHAGPSVGRAYISSTLGWLTWRAGPVADASELLGDDTRIAAAFSEQGLEVARRSMNRNAIAWIAGNLGDAAMDLGRMAAALDYDDEAIAAADAIGDVELARIKHLDRAWVRRHMGDLEGAAEDRLVFDGAALTQEPQLRARQALDGALSVWPMDPRAATEDIARYAQSDPEGLQPEVGVWLVRMALRIGEGRIVEQGIEYFDKGRGAVTGPIFTIQAEWVAAALDEPRSAAERCEAVGEQLQGFGRLLNAAEALADAAFHWDRTVPDGSASGSAAGSAAATWLTPGRAVTADATGSARARSAAERSTAMYRAAGAVPVLGWPDLALTAVGPSA